MLVRSIFHSEDFVTDIYFVTGTDTDVGKTLAVAALMQNAAASGKTVIGYKPVASGCEMSSEGLRNGDVLSALRNSNAGVSYGEIVSYQFREAIAPHIAAKNENVEISFDKFDADLARLLAKNPDAVFIEGAGGWMLPLGEKRFMADWAAARGFPVIMVIGARLGFLNHAVMTKECIESRGLRVAGYVLNEGAFAMSRLKENEIWLRGHMDSVPCLGVIPKIANPDSSDLSALVDISGIRL